MLIQSENNLRVTSDLACPPSEAPLVYDVPHSFVRWFRIRNGSCSWVGIIRYASVLVQATQLITKCFAGVAELLIFHPVDTIAKRLMSNKAKVLLRQTHIGGRANLVQGLVLIPEFDTFPRRGYSTSAQEAGVALPWSRIRCGIQGFAADLQVRRSTMVQRFDQEKLQGQLHEHVWRAEWKVNDPSNCWQVCPICSRDKFLVR